MASEQPTHKDADGLTVHGGSPTCAHAWEELPDEEDPVTGEILVPARDVCVSCGGVKY